MTVIGYLKSASCSRGRRTSTQARAIYDLAPIRGDESFIRGQFVKRRTEHCHKGITRGQRKIILIFLIIWDMLNAASLRFS